MINTIDHFLRLFNPSLFQTWLQERVLHTLLHFYVNSGYYEVASTSKMEKEAIDALLPKLALAHEAN